MVQTEERRPRLDSRLASAGAEYLVLGRLLVEGIQGFKAYANFPGYDLVVVNPRNNRSCRIQVKSRWATDYDKAFPIKSFDCDFVVLVALNRGFRYRKKPTIEDTGKRAVQFYVLPVDVVRKAREPRSRWGKSSLRRVPQSEQYLDNWDLLKSFLGMAGSH